MSTMSDGYRDAVANEGGSLISHIGLVDSVGTELDGGNPAYARLAVVWTTAPASGVGIIRPTENLVFNIPAATIVGGWRGYSALTLGTNYGGAVLAEEEFTGQGEYTLVAAGTGILHSNVA